MTVILFIKHFSNSSTQEGGRREMAKTWVEDDVTATFSPLFNLWSMSSYCWKSAHQVFYERCEWRWGYFEWNLKDPLTQNMEVEYQSPKFEELRWKWWTLKNEWDRFYRKGWMMRSKCIFLGKPNLSWK